MQGTRRRLGLISLAFLVALPLLAACDPTDPSTWTWQGPTDSNSVSCPAGETATFIHNQADNTVLVTCSGGKKEGFLCDTGVPEATKVGEVVTVTCSPLAVMGSELVKEEDFDVVLDGTEISPAAFEAIAGFSCPAAGQAWQATQPGQDLQGKLPDEPGRALNWRIRSTITWCVYQGVVRCGLSFVQHVTEGRMYEINERADGNSYVLEITPCNLRSRTMYVDWDFRFGWCPWCTTIDVDLRATVEGNRIYGKYTWNGDGI